MVEQRDSRLSSKYEGLLLSLNYKISSVEDDAVYFHDKEGFIYRLFFDEKTPTYIALVFGISGFVDDIDPMRRFNAVQYVNENIKCVKVYFDGESAQFSCEQFLYDVSNLQDFIEDSIPAMHVALKELVKVLRSDD